MGALENELVRIHKGIESLGREQTQTRTVMEERVPADLQARLSRIEAQAHTVPCDDLIGHFQAHNTETARLVQDRRAFWRRIVAGILVVLGASFIGWIAFVLLRSALDAGLLGGAP